MNNVILNLRRYKVASTLGVIQNPLIRHKRFRVKPGMTFLIFLSLISQLLFLAPPAQADTMSSGQYILQLNNNNAVPTPQPVQEPAQSNNSREIDGNGFSVLQGFPYIFSVNSFAFSISSLTIDYGPLSPTNPIIRQSLLSVDPGNAYSYSVLASENHELELKNGTTIIIPNTTCDDGLCSSDYGSTWVNTLTFGFGYHCDNLVGSDCISSKTNDFRQFAVEEEKNAPQDILLGTNTQQPKKAQISYKLNINTTQPKGLYSNIVTYTALPGY